MRIQVTPLGLLLNLTRAVFRLQLQALVAASAVHLVVSCPPQPSEEDSTTVETSTGEAAPFPAWAGPPGAAQ